MARAKLWISWLAGVVVFLEVMGGTFRLKSLMPDFSAKGQQRRTKIVIFRREPLIMNSTTSNATNPSYNISSSSSSYSSNSPWRSSRHLTGSWIGDSWIPPSPEWRLYSAREMRDIFRGQRIAFVGDSLGRRAAMTLFPILNHTMGGTAQHQQKQQHSHHLEDDIPRQWLDNPRDLTLNKASKKQEPCREYQWNGKHSPRICRTVVGGGDDDEESGILESTTADNQTRSIKATATRQPLGQVWQIWDPCFPDLLDWVQKELRGITNVTEGLDIVVVAAGIHDVQANPNCHRNKAWRPKQLNASSSYYEELTQVVLARLDVLLQTLLKLQRAKPHLTIVWKTCGYSAVNDDTADEKKRLVDRINERTMDILDQQQQQQQQVNATSATDGDTINDVTRTILYFDWGGAVKARSFGDARIQGDSINHYGLQARLVALQMLTNVLAAAQHNQPNLQ